MGAAEGSDQSEGAELGGREPPAARRTEPLSSRAIERLVVRSALRVLLLAVVLVVLVLLSWRLRLLLLLLAVSLFVAALVNPFVRALTRRGMRRASATVAVYVVVVVFGAGLGYTLFHPVVSSATRFAEVLPSLVRQAQAGQGQVGRLIARLHLARYVAEHAPQLQNAIAKLGTPALSVGKTVLSGVASLVTIAFLSFFLVLEVPHIFGGLLAWTSPERARRIRRTADAMARQVTGFMLGNLVTSLIAGVVVYVALRVTSVPFAGVLALWVGLVDVLPLIGGLLAGVPTVFVAFVHSVTAGIVATVVFLVYQQVENHVLNPLIISRTVRLNPLWVLLAVLVGAEVGGIIGSTFGAICGAILAVPGAGAIQVASRELLAHRAQEAAQRVD